MIKKKLLRSPTLRHASWDQFLPLETRKDKNYSDKKKILKTEQIEKENMDFLPIQNNSRNYNFRNKLLEPREDFNFKSKSLSKKLI